MNTGTSKTLLFLAFLTFLTLGTSWALPVTTEPAPIETRPGLAESFGKLPLYFERNDGQAAESVDYLARGAGYTLFLSDGRATLALIGGDKRSTMLHMDLVGAHATSQATALDRRPGIANYFIGNDPSSWQTEVPLYGKVRYEAVYPGIDVIYYGNQGRLEYDFVVAPGADPKTVDLRFVGAKSVSIVDGELLVDTALGKVVQHRPIAYQVLDGERRAVSSRYVMLAEDRVGFEIGSYDPQHELIIDPILEYISIIGASVDGPDSLQGMGVDATGAVYLCGWTWGTAGGSNDFPVTPGAYDTSFNGGLGPAPVYVDGWVAKVNPAGTAIVWATYLGSSGNDVPEDCAIDPTGAVYVVGSVDSLTFPTVGAFQSSFGGGDFDAFVSKLSPDGTTLVYSSYLGGISKDLGWNIAVHPTTHEAYLTGGTAGSFPVGPGYDTTYNGGDDDAWIAKVNAAGSALVYSTYLGGSNREFGESIAVDAGGSAYVVGLMRSTDFPTTAGVVQPTAPGDDSGFVAKLSPDGLSLVYSTYLGSDRSDQNYAVNVDSTGHAYVAGRFSGSGFPGSPALPAFQTYFLSKLDPTAQNVIYTQALGRGGGWDIDFGPGGEVAVCGRVFFDTFLEIDAFPSSGSVTNTDFGVAVLDAAGTPYFASMVGGPTSEGHKCNIAVTPSGDLIISSSFVPTWSEVDNFLTPTGTFAQGDGIFIRINDVDSLPAFSKAFASAILTSGAASTLTFTIDNSANASAVANLAFTDNLPAGMSIAAPPNASTTCTGGTLDALASGTSISYSSGTVAAASSCTLSVDVTATVLGSYVNTSGALTSDVGNSGTATATLGVAAPPAFSKAFSPATIEAGQVTTLTFTIDSTANAVAVSGLAFSDNLPSALRVATPPNASSTCGGSVTAVAGGTTISFSSGAVSAGATCTVQVDITTADTSAAVAGTHVNTSGDLTSVVGSSGTASATLDVLLVGFDTPLSGTNLSFEDFVVADGVSDPTLPGWTATGAFTFNPDAASLPGEATDGANTAAINAGTITQTTTHVLRAGTRYAVMVDVGDRLGLAFPGYTIELLADGVAFATATSPTTPADGTFVTASLIGNAGASEDSKMLGVRLSSTGVQTNFDDVRLFESEGEPVVTITSPAFGSTVAPGVNINFTATATDAEDGNIAANLVWNSSIDGNFGTGASVSTSALSTGNHAIVAMVSDSDSNPGSDSVLLSIAVHAAPVVNITSPADGSAFASGANINLTATATDAEDGNIAANLVWTSNLAGGLGSGASLSVSSLALGTHTITASVNDSGGQNGQDSVNVHILTPPGFSQAFSPATITAGNTSTLTFTIDSTSNLATTGNLAFSDTLPNELVVATPANAMTTCGGTVTAPNGATTISFSGGSVVASSTCTVSVDVTTVDATAGSTGQHLDTSEDLTSDAGNSGPASATLTVLLPGFDTFLTGSNLDFEAVSVADGAFSPIVPSWTVSNAFTVNPATTDFPSEAPEGENTAAINAGSLTQILGTTLIDGAGYVVIVEVGDRLGFGFGGFTLELLADGVAFASLSNSVSPADGTFATAALTATASAAENGKTLGVRLVSAGIQTHFDDVRLMKANAPPVVSITSPNNNDTFLPGASVSFAGTASDAEDGDLSASIAWTSSLDGSIGSGASFALTTLSIGTHTITATVTDSGGAMASANLQVVITANNPPVVTITSPSSGTYTSGSNLAFTATAIDAEDGDLSASLVWTSDRDGNIGTGAAFSTRGLSTGTHTITASATDSGSATGSSMVSVTLNPGTLLTNPSFEADCPAIDGDHNTNLTGWTKTAGVGTFNPTLPRFPADVPDGQCSAFANSGSMTQVMGATVVADRVYALTVSVGDRADTAFPGYTIQIFIDGVLRASANETDAAPLDGQFTSVSIEVTSTAADAGKALEVRLLSGGTQINFDDVRLVAETAPTLPSFSKAFAPATISVGATTTLTFTIDNSGGGAPVGSLAFTDTLPSQLVVAATPATATTCGGTVTAVAASNTISFTGGMVGTAATCTAQVDITTLNTSASMVGTHNNLSGALSTDLGSAGTATADLTVVLAGLTTDIAVANASFEDLVLTDGDFNASIPLWTQSGTTFSYNPTTAQFASEAPDGNNTAALNFGSLTQTTATILEDGKTYGLVVEVGDRADSTFATYTLQLLADGVVFATATSPIVPADGTFATATLIGAAGASEDGKTLGVRLSSGGIQLNFDNVRLMSD